MIKIITPSVEIINNEDVHNFYLRIEEAGRTAYKSEGKITPDSSKPFIQGLLKSGHLSVLEHVSLSVRVITSRGVTHEIVRHRLGSYTQESTRYCKYDNGLTVIRPSFFRHIPLGEFKDTMDISAVSHGYMSPAEFVWCSHMVQCEYDYTEMLNNGCTPQQARGVLPNDLKTEIIITYNLRQWLHFFDLRYHGKTGKPHPDMKEVATLIFNGFMELLPEIFNEENN